MQIHLGYLEDFKGRNVILISGDRDGLHELADQLRSLESSYTEPVEIHKLPFAQAHGEIGLTAYPVEKEDGVRRVPSNNSQPRFTWHHSEEGWLEAAEKIQPVADSGSGHNYLECIGVEDASVLVSSGEYDEGWWREHT